MKRLKIVGLCLALLVGLSTDHAFGQTANTGSGQTARIVGTVKDQVNGIALPGVPIEVVGTDLVEYTDVDGRYVLTVPVGTHTIKVLLDGYQERQVMVAATPGRPVTADVGLTMNAFSETVVVRGEAVDLETNSAEAQLIERKQAAVIVDNVGSQDMRDNGDGDAASAMTRVTGLSLVDNQFVFVRGLGERYSNTTLGGSVLPTTEPDKKVVPLDLFPTGLIDSIQVNKSYSPDRSAEFAGGLVQIIPMKLPNQPVMNFSYGLNFYTNATGKSIPLSPLGNRDWLGFDNGARALPSAFPDAKLVRRGIYTPSVGYSQAEMNQFGQLLENRWSPVSKSGAPGQNWNATFGNRFNKKLGVVGSVTHSYREQFIDEERRFFRIADDTDLEAVSDYRMQTGTQRAQIGIVGNVAYQFTPSQRVSLENFYTHSGRDEGRTFQGPNLDNAFEYKDYRVQFIEEGMMSNMVTGEHFFQGLANSRFDWRATTARATRDEPDLREVLYERPLNSAATVPFVLADESQSGFRMFNALNDDTIDVAGNWAMMSAAGGRATQYKFGASYIERSRDFRSRRFHFIPVILNKDGTLPVSLRQSEPEVIFTSANVGTNFRFSEETRPVDAYSGDQSTTSGYGMVDIAFSAQTRLIAGARVEKFDQKVNTFDPFGLFSRTISAENKNTDVFPSVNLVRAVGANANLRVSYSTTVNRPEFRELAEFEFTDVVGNRAVKGNPNLNRALIQNVDGRWESFRGGRGVLAASVFYKHFDKPIERVVIAAANPIVTFQNSDRATNFGIELEAAHEFSQNFFITTNYTFVDSKITLLAEQRAVQTSLERPLAGQSRHLFNASADYTMSGFGARMLFNYFDDRISDVGANQAPDVLEQGRATLDLVLSQRVRGMNFRVTMENLTDVKYRFTQGANAPAPQRLYQIGRTIAFSVGLNVF